MKTLVVQDWGLNDYRRLEDAQARLTADKINGDKRDYLILFESGPVVTIGTGGFADQLPNGVEAGGPAVVPVGRGGGATYHGPGQLIAYPIVDLRPTRDIRLFVGGLERAAVKTLRDFELPARVRPGWTGVWVADKKIVSIGIKVRHWITSYGLAINIANDLAVFQRMRPCGLDGKIMTSMEMLGCRSAAVKPVADVFAKRFLEVFKYEVGFRERNKSGGSSVLA